MDEIRMLDLEEKVDFLEFRIELLADPTHTNKTLFAHGITKKQYKHICQLMDEVRAAIDDGKKVSHISFERDMYEIVPQQKDNYHFCEALTKAFMLDRRWGEAFPYLYGDMPKHQHFMANFKENIETKSEKEMI